MNRFFSSLSMRIITSLMIVLIGFVMMAIGAVGLFDLKPDPVMTDQEVIKRAKGLGMIELKEQLEPKDQESEEETKTQEETTTKAP